ncbi:MAG: STAS domain-containing protein [Paludibacteraceae bacterium]|jgi:anti-sigma B factor antagonist|nr:STAS domain-containing protein [Paludibacteraceae bacterium]MCR4619199.1 STAS domain-containing protein [Paludibacteraceae bacterium]
MELEIIEEEERTIVNLPERIDTVNAQDFEQSIVSVLEKSEGEVVYDARNMNYISSSGLRVMLKSLQTLQSKKVRFSIANMIPSVKHVFDMTGFSNIIPITSK